MQHNEKWHEQFIDDLPEPVVEVKADELETHFAKMNRLASKAKPVKKRDKHVQVPLFDRDFLDGVEQLELIV